MRAVLIAALLFATPVAAQDAETLADIRQELTVLYVELQKLKRELSTNGRRVGSLCSHSAVDVDPSFPLSSVNMRGFEI